jgi:diadenosine tetraphosphate (Ap4A) HIT family hydrolase
MLFLKEDLTKGNKMMPYDHDNIFAKILRGEIPCKKRYEDDHSLAFDDINPQSPTHILLIPKQAYSDFSDFSKNASAEEITSFFRALGMIAEPYTMQGYRLISNCGSDSGQLVPHFHMHLCAGKKLGAVVVG